MPDPSQPIMPDNAPATPDSLTEAVVGKINDEVEDSVTLRSRRVCLLGYSYLYAGFFTRSSLYLFSRFSSVLKMHSGFQSMRLLSRLSF